MPFSKFVKNIFNRIFNRINKRIGILFPSEDIRIYTDRIIADGILLNEIPSPADKEELRGDFIRRRLTEFGIDNIHTDEFGNIFVLFPGNGDSRKYLLVYSDIDNFNYSASESIVEMNEKKLTGIGIGDNSIGVSALIVLCEYIRKNNVSLDINLIVLFSLRNTPEYNYAGIRFFMDQWYERIYASIYLFGLNIGKLVLDSYGIYNISLSLKSGNTDALGKNYTDSTVDFAAKLYNEINKIDWNMFNAIVNIVRITTGVGFEYFPQEGTMDIEIFSKDQESLNSAKSKVMEIAEDVSKNKNYTIENKTVSYIPPALDKQNEVLNGILKNVHKSLSIETKISNIPDYSSIINQFKIPSITLGMTTGKKTLNSEFVEIRNILNGFKQVLYIIDNLNQKINRMDKNG